MSSPVKIKYPINSYYTSIIIIWEIPFDYSKFLKQIDHKNATKIARMVKNFELEFERHPRTINDQIKFVREFLDFITGKMRECELWRNASEQEFENAKEGIEKLVMNRLHKLTFTPAIKGPPVTDDIERDNILYQKIEIFRWVREQHLDIPITPHNEAFFDFAKKELLKINDYKAPRDKLICILNCCKVIYGLIKLVDGEEGADKFLPVLIFVILKANPEYLMSNVQFRSPEKLQSEAGYYLSSL
ncbi:6761_t:CDS:2, partial [Entrophospora sp. SA101]